MPATVPSDPHPGLTAARAPRAVGPREDAESLRRAYLELLKLAVCDLVGPTTSSVGRMDRDGTVTSRDMEGEQLRLRAAGMDWPLHGLTMVGLNRLDDLQRCVESVVRDDVPGDLIEAGSWRGGASIVMRATLDSLGDSERTVWVADSFRGFPAQGDSGAEWAAMDFLAVPLEEVRANFARLGLDHGVEYLPGFFEETMPRLAEEDRAWSLVRLDGDTYEATWVTLQALYPALSTGGYLVVDDYGAIEDCRRAVDDFRDRHGIDEPLERGDWTSARWRKASEAPIDAPFPSGPRTAAGGVSSTGEPPARRAVPTAVEHELRREVAELRERLATAEAELAAFRSSPLKGPRDWVRGRLDRGSSS